MMLKVTVLGASVMLALAAAESAQARPNAVAPTDSSYASETSAAPTRLDRSDKRGIRDDTEFVPHDGARDTGRAIAVRSPPSKAVVQQQHESSSKKKAKPTNLSTVMVVGLRASQQKSLQRKRTAANVEDTITAVNIGQLPDITISDSISRIPGVQVTRVAGQGTSVAINGLPEVRTLLNGNAYLDALTIGTPNANYGTLPSSLFAGVDVYKSPMSSLPGSGISGTINLRSRRPWDLPFGWTAVGDLRLGRGSVAQKTRPDGSFLVGYNARGDWGVLFDVSYTSLVHSFASDNLTSYRIHGENSSSANGVDGFFGTWGALHVPVPKQVVSLGSGGVDVNGDGQSNGAFLLPNAIQADNKLYKPHRIGLSASFQDQLGDAFTLTADGFYVHETQNINDEGFWQENIKSAQAATLPLMSQKTGVIVHNALNAPGVQSGNWNQQLYTTNGWIKRGIMFPITNPARNVYKSGNYDVQLHFDNGGRFQGTLRFVTAVASTKSNSGTILMLTGNGAAFPNQLKPGVSLPNTVWPAANKSGLVTFNPNGFPPNTPPVTVDWTGAVPSWNIPSAAKKALADPSLDAYGSDGFYGQGSSNHASMNVLRFDGRFRFSPNVNVQFGARNVIRGARSNEYVWETPVYAGEGASDPGGCITRYTNSAVILNGAGVPGACTAGNQYGYFRANKYLGRIPTLPAPLSDTVPLKNPAGVQGISTFVVDANALSHPFEVHNALYPGTFEALNPGASWRVFLHHRSGFGQLNFNGLIGSHKVRGNFGVTVRRTDLHVTQLVPGKLQPYVAQPPVAATVHTTRHFTNVLPAFNVALNITPKLIWRLAWSKRMMPLALSQWGGGFNPAYHTTILPNGKSLLIVVDASSGGNANLKPWHSTNYNSSLEYYFSPGSIVSLSYFYINVASFVSLGGRQSCAIPDSDGVVRRCVPVTGPVQGSGAILHGLSGQFQQAFTSLPGILGDTGAQLNATYAPSSTGKTDMAGKSIPFPGNSEWSGNAVLWYQHEGLQLRVGYNYRSTTAVAENVSGIVGLEEYEAPQGYLSASIRYQLTPNVEVELYGQNLTDEKQQFYDTWKTQKQTVDLSERYFMAGVHVQF